MKFKEKRPLYLLQEIAAILRAENGCAWDREQTSRTLKPYLIEEAYETYEAIDSGRPDHLQEELGDLLYQVYAHAQIADEEGTFTIDDVAQGIVDKLVRRHPHVFGEVTARTAQDVIDRWEKQKLVEKAHRESMLDGVPVHLPALLKAYRVQQKVSRVGFDWDKIDDVVKKLHEELDEFTEALKKNSYDEMEEEIGDILFTIANISRFVKVNPEDALSGTVNKFMRRFKYIESRVSDNGQTIDEMSLEELDRLWEEAKAGE